MLNPATTTKEQIMYHIRDELARPRGHAGSISAAEAALERLCAEAHAQAVANGEGTRELWHRFEVVDEAGQVVMFRAYSPDPSTPYVPLNNEEGA